MIHPNRTEAAVQFPEIDWPAVIARLKARGWSQRALAVALGVRPSILSDLFTGRQNDTSYLVGRALMGIHDAGIEPPVTVADAARRLIEAAETRSAPTLPKRRERSVRAVQ